MNFFGFFLVRFFFKNSIELKQHLIETKNYRINKNKQDTHVIHSYKHTNTQEGRKLKKNLRTWQKKNIGFSNTKQQKKNNPKNSLRVNSNNNNNNKFSEFKNSHRNPEMIFFFYIYIFGTKKNKYLPQQTNKKKLSRS